MGVSNNNSTDDIQSEISQKAAGSSVISAFPISFHKTLFPSSCYKISLLESPPLFSFFFFSSFGWEGGRWFSQKTLPARIPAPYSRNRLRFSTSSHTHACKPWMPCFRLHWTVCGGHSADIKKAFICMVDKQETTICVPSLTASRKWMLWGLDGTPHWRKTQSRWDVTAWAHRQSFQLWNLRYGNL